MWRAYLIETMTGLVGAEVEMSTNGRYDITLNGIEQATVTVQKSSLRTIPPRWLRPWAQGILLTLEADGQAETPILAGPITAPPDEYPESVSYSVSGIRAVFQRRLATARDYGRDADAMRKSKLHYSDRSLAYIAQDLVKRGMAKEAGELPIYIPRAASSAPGGHERVYYGYDVANNDIDKRLSELSNVVGGPDIMFRPEWRDSSHRYIRWGMYTGMPWSPVIAQDWTMVIDAGAPQPQISELSLNVSGEHYATRFIATGDGEGAGVRTSIAQNDRLHRDQHPLLEGTESWPSVSVPSTLRAYAEAGVDTKPFVEIHATLDGTDPRSPLGRWHVGDSAVLKPGPWMTIPDREVNLRVVRAEGDFDTTHTTIYFQEDQW